MGWFGRILLGGAMVAAGYVLVRYADWFVYNVMRVPWAERWLRSSHNFYRMLGVIVICLGFLVMTNMFDAFMQATLGSLFAPKQQ